MPPTSEAYKRSGVDIEGGNRAVELMRSAVQSTHGPQVLADTGAFGGAFALDGDTVLVASTDSVGTKVRLTSRLGRHRGIGLDLVNHCVNDILAMGARPLFFLDYYASSKVLPEVVAEVVQGIADACCEAGAALLGGETAELPGMYAPGEYDIAGFIVGRVARDRLLPSSVRSGDLLVALPSSGLHTNGFSLVHHILSHEGLEAPEALLSPREGLPQPLADLLLEPHKPYFPEVWPLLEARLVRGIAHITGGGLIENVPRSLPKGLQARVDVSTWLPPAIFGWLQERGDVTSDEMYRVFNMGVGMVLIVRPADRDAVLDSVGGSWLIGEVTEGAEPFVFSGVPSA